jgi:hypothetical protein
MYQAAGTGTGKTVQFDVYKPDKTIDATQSGAATEIGATGRYYKSFDADAPGWSVEISDNAGGKAVKHFGQEKYDAHGMGGGINDLTLAVADVQTAVDAANVALGVLDTAIGVVDGKIDTAIGDIGTVQTDVTAALAALAIIDGKVNSISAPPMVG